MTTKLTWTFLLFSLLGLLFYAFNLTQIYAASQNYSSGYYINLSGGGADVNGNIGGYNDEADCQPGNGVCYARNRNNSQNYANGHTDKYICNGRVTNCDNTNSPGNVVSFNTGYSQTISGASCGQTVQLDVFDGNSLHGFMTWYAGDCAYGGAASPQPGNVTVTTCNNRIISQATLQQELRGAGYPGPWGDVNTELAAFNRAACPSQPTPTPTPSPTPVPVGGTTNTTTYVYVYPSPSPTPSPTVKIVTAAAPVQKTAPQKTVYVQAQNLPATGPEAAVTLLLTGAPIGFLFRKIAQRISENYII
jgi:hypothetical protein